MDIYSRRSLWNTLLAIIGLMILVVTIVYTNYLSKELAISEKKNQELFINATRKLAESDDGDLTFLFNIQQNFSIPVVVKYEDGTIQGNNWGEKRDTFVPFLEAKRAAYLNSGQEITITEAGQEIYFFDSPLYAQIQYFPIVQGLLIFLFVFLGYYTVTSSRRAEQNRVWAGMAKETAHQLGTPISAILAWIEFLKESNQERPEELDVINELSSDVERLELIADRFSKIGSKPELEEVNIYEELAEIKTYMARRASKKVEFDFPELLGNNLSILANKHLLTWVMENLLRNALDAMEGIGKISALVYSENNFICIDLSDTGKGIPAGKFKTVFQPGFSTKKRGWGLGLSLAKRIIEEYHKGKIFIKSSRPNEGTTFTIKLPAV
ncbi:MAG: HAMP domain-containing sensor histidine kinase [Saprospiraceae bacterium]